MGISELLCMLSLPLFACVVFVVFWLLIRFVPRPGERHGRRRGFEVRGDAAAADRPQRPPG